MIIAIKFDAEFVIDAYTKYIRTQNIYAHKIYARTYPDIETFIVHAAVTYVHSEHSSGVGGRSSDSILI